MADFQYQPAQDDPLARLRGAMATMDGQCLFLLLCCNSFLVSERSDDNTVEGIRGYRFPQETEDYTTEDPSAMDVDIDPQLAGRSHPEAQHSTQRSNLRLFPPPIFSRQGIPQNYKYVRAPPHFPSGSFRNSICFAHVPRFVACGFSFKANPMSTVTTVIDERTGEEKERLINKGRWKGFGPTSVSFSEKGVGGSSCFLPLRRKTRSFSEFLTSCMILQRSRPSPHRTSKKCATSTINPSFRGWKR